MWELRAPLPVGEVINLPPNVFSRISPVPTKSYVQVYPNLMRTKFYDGSTKALPYGFEGRLPADIS